MRCDHTCMPWHTPQLNLVTSAQASIITQKLKKYPQPESKVETTFLDQLSSTDPQLLISWYITENLNHSFKKFVVHDHSLRGVYITRPQRVRINLFNIITQDSSHFKDPRFTRICDQISF
jgi:hypothetical protein